MYHSSRISIGKIYIITIIGISSVLLHMPSYGEIFIVDTNADSGVGSLRDALQLANTAAGKDSIFFAIPGSGPHSIRVLTSLPAIHDSVLIDGYSQSGTSFATETEPAVLLIEIDGSVAGSTTSGLDIHCSHCLVRGLVINRFSRYGIHVTSGSNTIVEGNHIGTDVAGFQEMGNGFSAIRCDDSSNNIIGGIESGSRNVISGNGSGVIIYDGSNNVVCGNYIGIDASGAIDLGNTGRGISVINGSNNTIGGPSEGFRNVISGNYQGISLQRTSYNIIRGNYIGTDASGYVAIGQLDNGIDLFDTHHNTIGGSAVGEGNVISASSEHGIQHHCYQNFYEHNLIIGNRIGTDVSGSSALPNMGSGISLGYLVSDHTIGGTAPGEGNIISGNGEHGIYLHSPMWHTKIQGNKIGIGADGMPLGNGGHGILIVPPAMDNMIGGIEEGAGNIIACNDSAGIRVERGGADIYFANSIHSNGTLGIDLGDEGVTPNDPEDFVVNYPALTSVTSYGGSTTITGNIEGDPDKEYRLEFFSNSESDPSGHGEGEVLLGASTVTTDSVGDAAFVVMLPNEVTGGRYVSATATEYETATSEFCEDVLVMKLQGDLSVGELTLSWTSLSGVTQYWLYGASNNAFFSPMTTSPYDNRLAVLPTEATAWGAPNGIDDPNNNWTYQVIAVTALNLEIARSNRIGEFDYSLSIP